MNRTFIKIAALSISLLYVDLFCGAGGTSTGVESAKVNKQKTALVISCVNHDKNAIASHAENHPEAQHFTEDMRTLYLAPLAKHVAEMRKKYPFAKLILWASLECTNHSNAKGGMSRDADSRTLAEHVNRYVIALKPDSVQIENVKEFMDWGPLKQKEKDGILQFDKKGNPIMHPDPLTKGTDFKRWVESVKKLGYSYDYRILNSADFNAYTSRRRFFAQFAAAGFPTVWPEPTHEKNGVNLPKWNAVKHCLDFSEEGKSIFGRKTPIVDNTLKRIYAGMEKFVPVGEEKFISKYYSGNPESRNTSLIEPCHTIPTNNRHSLVENCFLSAYYGTGDNVSSVEDSCPVVPTKDRFAIVNYTFLDQQFGKSKPASIENSCNAVTVNPKFAKVDCNYFLMNPQYQSKGGSINDSCFTLIARMDKAPPYLVEASHVGVFPSFIKIKNNVLIYEIYESDSEILKKIKEFMAAHGLIDVKMRMLFILELKKIMGFPEDYVLIGTQAEQKKYIGNAVEVNVAKAMCEAIANELFKMIKAA